MQYLVDGTLFVIERCRLQRPTRQLGCASQWHFFFTLPMPFSLFHPMCSESSAALVPFSPGPAVYSKQKIAFQRVKLDLVLSGAPATAHAA
jgi:hypothetical protein